MSIRAARAAAAGARACGGARTDHVDVGQAEKGERLEHLPRKLADQRERDALEVRAPQQLVEVEGHVLKHEARVPAVVKRVEEAHCACGVRVVREGRKSAQ